MKRAFQKHQERRCHCIGCLHLLPLPGSPGWQGSLKPVADQCLREAKIYLEHGADGLIIENTHDLPYLRSEAEPATVAAMAAMAAQVRQNYPAVPIGIQVLAAADLAALEIAVACDLDFIRAEGFAYAHVADEGIIQGDAGRLLRRRVHLRASDIEIWTDVKKKHGAHALTADLSAREFGKGAVFCGADGLIVTGGTTGEPPSLEAASELQGLGVPLAVGSGVTSENIAAFANVANVLIVGSACKKAGDWRNEVQAKKVGELIQLMAKPGVS